MPDVKVQFMHVLRLLMVSLLVFQNLVQNILCDTVHTKEVCATREDILWFVLLGLISGRGRDIFLCHSVQTASRHTHPPILWMGAGRSFFWSGVK
jgi:hypothetical protein